MQQDRKRWLSGSDEIILFVVVVVIVISVWCFSGYIEDWTQVLYMQGDCPTTELQHQA